MEDGIELGIRFGEDLNGGFDVYDINSGMSVRGIFKVEYSNGIDEAASLKISTWAFDEKLKRKYTSSKNIRAEYKTGEKDPISLVGDELRK